MLALNNTQALLKNAGLDQNIPAHFAVHSESNGSSVHFRVYVWNGDVRREIVDKKFDNPSVSALDLVRGFFPQQKLGMLVTGVLAAYQLPRNFVLKAEPQGDFVDVSMTSGTQKWSTKVAVSNMQLSQLVDVWSWLQKAKELESRVNG